MTTTSPDNHDDLTGHDDEMPHKPADDREQVYYNGRPMLRSELAKGWLWILIGLVIIAIPVLIEALKKQGTSIFPWWVFAICVLIGILIVLVPYLQTKTVCYKITNYRIDLERGLIAKRIDTLELWHVEDLSMSQSIVDRILGVGTVTVLSHDENMPRLAMRGIPNPRPLFETLKQRVIAVKRQRGVVKMDIGG